MMQNNILKIQAFQYECFSTISEESYLKFCEHLNILATQAQQLRDDVFSIKKVNACCQTNGTLSNASQIKKTQVQPPPKPSAPAAVAVAKERIFTLTDDSDFQQDRHLSKRDIITCDYCELKFNSLIKMQQHVNIAHSEDFTSKFFPCQKCDLVFLSVDELSEHSVCAHEVSEDNKFEDDQLCPYCCEVKLSWVQYVSHLEAEHHVLVCKTCHTFCSDSNSLEEHIKKSHMSGITKEEIRELVVPVQEPKPVNKVPFNKRPFDDLVGIKKRGRPKRTEVNTEEFTVLKCHFCNALFNSEDSLRKHIVYKHDTGELQCRECNLKFKRASAYENHMRLFHKKVKELKSAYSKSSPDKDTVNSQQQPLLQKLLLKSVRKEESKKNRNLVRGQSKPSCEICGEMCNRAEDQEMHKDFHITRKPDRFLCLFCNEPAMPQKELKTHIMSEHRYRCPFCALTFWWKANLESHLKQLHRTKNCCILCGLQAEGEALRNHIIDMHMVKKAYICKVCNAEHLTLKEMSEHEKNHTRPGCQPPTCDFCSRSFGRKKSLKGHILRHIFGSFSCSLCGVQCKTPEELHLHLGEHQKSQFACMCGEYFQTKGDLQMHQKNTPCKPFFNQPIHRADLFVEVCVEDRDEDMPAFPAPATVRIVESGDHQLEDIFQINIAETPAQVSRNFMKTLATANKANQLVLPRQPILILNTLDGTEATLIENKSTGIMSWVDNSNITKTDVTNIDNTG